MVYKCDYANWYTVCSQTVQCTGSKVIGYVTSELPVLWRITILIFCNSSSSSSIVSMLCCVNSVDVCEQIVKLKQIEHVIYEKRVSYSMNFPFCVRSEFTFKVGILLYCIW